MQVQNSSDLLGVSHLLHKMKFFDYNGFGDWVGER